MGRIDSAASSGGWKLRLDYQVRQDREANRSEVACQLWVYAGAGGSYNNCPNEAYYKICGRKVFQVYDFPKSGWYKLGERTVSVGHDAAGHGKATLSAEWCSENRGSAYTPLRLSLGKTVEMPAIPRASGLRFERMTLGQESKLTVVRAEERFTHRISLTLGDRRFELTDGAVKETVIRWKPPLSLAEDIPDSGSGKGTLKIVTYDRGKVLGEKEYGVALLVPSSLRPSAELTVEIVNEGSVQGWPEAIEGWSRVRFQAAASGVYGSTITSGSFRCGGETVVGLSGVTGVLEQAGTVVPSVTVVDSRGRSTTVKGQALVVHEWYAPGIGAARVERCDEAGAASEDGTFVAVQCRAACAPVNGRNTVTVWMRSRPMGGIWGGWTEIPSGGAVVPGFESMVSYEVELEARDLLGGRKTVRCAVPTAAVALHLREGGRGAAFGKYSGMEGLEVDWPARFYRDVDIDGQLRVGGRGLLAAEEMTVAAVNGASYRVVWTRQSSRALPALGLAAVNASLELTVTATVPAGEMMVIGQLAAHRPAGLCAAAVYAASSNERRYMAMIDTEGRVALRPSTAMPESSYTLYLSAVYMEKGGNG